MSQLEVESGQEPDDQAENPVRTKKVRQGAKVAGTRNFFRHLSRWSLIVVALVLVVAIAAGGWVVWTIERSFPQTSGEIALSGLEQQVDVIRDAEGVPTIVANSSHDLFYAQGFVHAQDR